MNRVVIEPTWEGFRKVARSLLQQEVDPQRVCWEESNRGGTGSLFGEAEVDEGAQEPGTARVPRKFVELGRAAACHRDPSAWPWLYRIVWRIQTGERELLEDAADPDVAELLSMERSVRRDAHKMKAFVRFRSVNSEDGERFVAWFEPHHRIVRWTAPFFQRRFPSMNWSILTPEECVHWDGKLLSYSPGVSKSMAPEDDDLESFWLTYYAHTFNPARVRTNAMRAEMPVFYWKNLPEAASIGNLLRDAPSRLRDMIDKAGDMPPPAPRREHPAVVRERRPDPTMRDSLEPPADLHPLRTPGIRVGVAGWDYPDWGGRVYPEQRNGVDRLRWVSKRFDLIEVNATFYRPASERVVRSWIDRSRDRPNLRFAAKLHSAFTHRDGPWSEAEVAAVRKGMDPLHEAGLLKSLLVQFPWSFKNQPADRRRLRRIVRTFGDLPVHVEVRHSSWDDPAFHDWLREQGVGIVNIDQPLFAQSIVPAAEITNRIGYLRLHGRNSANWFREDATRDERYDYLYSQVELEPWVQRAVELSARDDVDEVEVVFNNHYRAQAVNNAETFSEMLAGRTG